MGRIDKEHTAEALVDGPLDRQASIDLPKQVERLTLTTTPAQERHREKVRDLMRAAHEKSVFGDIPFSDAKFDRAFDNTLHASGQYLGLVVTLGDRVLGSCYCALGGYFIGEGGRIVSVTTFNIDPGCGTGLLGGKAALRLAKGIEVWAQSQQATHVLYHVTGGIEIGRADRFFRKIGMKTLGGNYGKRVI
ncbi:hypothetical protein [uncultured Roseobacter sp.]|uniref:hypothetical protein n=1 Tax=uncultured Roseobacter sp. TaxID=114847 RepID=UPI002630ED98|nr:hypothetical protein [uncultured Roseobacter sp.]